ncbi:hypothetical protein FOB41_10030 [Agrobacterium pusense]|uniref:Uncharacterized protein n=1 Tax=Agrobacterium pusense TaxID=648995 RepID=A0A6H0ZKX8_9HYPH|nr:hypothetical protein [Agrobacterium pusense]QIX21448.1 hypothetical protein FOB41_10030 [Agrobacterium pusense]
MGEFKKGDFVRRTSNGSLTSTFGSHDKGFVGQIDDIVYRGGTTDIIFTNGHEGIITEYEPWQPRVGERVRVVRAELSHKADRIGLEFNVTHESYKVCNGVQTWGGDNAGGCVWRADELEPILAATPKKPTTLKIEAGRFYKTRDGRKVGPVRLKATHGSDGPYRIDGLWNYLENGLVGSISNGDHKDDLIAEWIDKPAAKPSNDNAKPNFKVGDRVKCLKSCPGQFTAGKEYVVSADHFGRKYESVKVKVDDAGSTENGWLPEFFELSKPKTTTIVALIENGQPKPSSTPHVHTSTSAAEKEAKRLAAKFKGQQFGVFTLTATHKEERVYEHKWQNMAALGLKIDAIKELRAVAGLDLLSAKRAVEAFAA